MISTKWLMVVIILGLTIMVGLIILSPSRSEKVCFDGVVGLSLPNFKGVTVFGTDIICAENWEIKPTLF